MRVLVSILTSSKPDLAKHCYDSVVNQQFPGYDYDIVVIVNSKNPEHIHDIRRHLPSYANIQETESNGRPGKGHNSVLRHFQSQPEYDYCVMVDGDDFLYPRALSRLQHYLKYGPDVLFIAFHDILQSSQPSSYDGGNMPYISFRNKLYLSYNVDAISIGDWHRVKGDINPFQRDINHMNTLARPFVFSRKSLDHDIYYDENMRLYDDFIVSLKCFEHHLLGNLKMYMAVDSNLYLYNSTPLDAATKRYFNDSEPEMKPARIEENTNYQKSIRNRFLTLKQWDIKQIPLLELGQNSEPDDFLAKCQFIDELTANLDLRCMVPQHDNIDVILQHCREVGNTQFHDDLIQTREWLCKIYST